MYKIGLHLDATREARVDTRLTHADRSADRAYLPDVEVTVSGRFPEGQRRGAVEGQPDLAIEVLSPDDRADRVMDKIRYYLASGVRLVWVVDPERETFVVYTPDAAPRSYAAPAVVDAQPVLGAFELDLAALFAVLHAANA